MGGGIVYKAFLNEEIVNIVTIEQIHESSSWSFIGIMGGDDNFRYFTNYTNKNFKKDAVVNIKFNGGHYPLPNSKFIQNRNGYYTFELNDVTKSLGDWNEYVRSIKDNLAPVHYKLIPIYMMFDDLEIRNNMKIGMNM